jgi:uncharacterized protein YjbI with pentapeptide repeats
VGLISARQGCIGLDLSGADLSRASLTKADLRGINIRGANLIGADLSETRMRIEKASRELQKFNSELLSIQLSELICRMCFSPRLRDADLTGADLTGAQLQEVDLTRVELSYANLQGADLTGAMLTGVMLDEADLRAAKATEEQLQTILSKRNMKQEP